jgi:phosphohistidine phosphatase SixA
VLSLNLKEARMNLYLVRHATPETTTGDPSLGTKGKQEAATLAALFGRLNLAPDQIKLLTSPAWRAHETATVISGGLGLAPSALALFPTPPEVTPDGALLNTRLMQRLAKVTTEEHRSQVIVVGHLPTLTQAFAWLVGHDRPAFPGAYATTACLQCAPTFAQGQGELQWLILPELLP